MLFAIFCKFDCVNSVIKKGELDLSSPNDIFNMQFCMILNHFTNRYQSPPKSLHITSFKPATSVPYYPTKMQIEYTDGEQCGGSPDHQSLFPEDGIVYIDDREERTCNSPKQEPGPLGVAAFPHMGRPSDHDHVSDQ